MDFYFLTMFSPCCSVFEIIMCTTVVVPVLYVNFYYMLAVLIALLPCVHVQFK